MPTFRIEALQHLNLQATVEAETIEAAEAVVWDWAEAVARGAVFNSGYIAPDYDLISAEVGHDGEVIGTAQEADSGDS